MALWVTRWEVRRKMEAEREMRREA